MQRISASEALLMAPLLSKVGKIVPWLELV